jgi:hypothetical protein
MERKMATVMRDSPVACFKILLRPLSRRGGQTHGQLNGMDENWSVIELRNVLEFLSATSLNASRLGFDSSNGLHHNKSGGSPVLFLTEAIFPRVQLTYVSSRAEVDNRPNFRLKFVPLPLSSIDPRSASLANQPFLSHLPYKILPDNHPVFTSLDVATFFFRASSSVLSPPPPQSGGLGPCIYIRQWPS